MRHFLDLSSIPQKELKNILNLAHQIKKNHNLDLHTTFLRHKNLAMIFEKSSTRTKISFELAIRQLGGNAVIISKADSQLGKGETIEDTAKVLSRFVDCIMLRCNSHESLLKMVKNASVPVINGLSDFSHPCQIIASLITIEEHLQQVSGKKLAWFGDQNNVLNSYIHAAQIFDFELAIASPNSFNFSNEEVKKAKSFGAKIYQTDDPKEAAKNADVLITDTWISMGDLAEQNQEAKDLKLKALRPFSVSKDLMSLAKKGAIFTHCLPAYRGFEVESEVIDSAQSVVFDEAENRLHAQKAILLWLFNLENVALNDLS